MSLESSLKQVVEKIARSIPGFNGYYSREKRREEEKIVRDYMADKLSRVNRNLNNIVREITKSGDITVLDIYGRTQKELEKSEDRIRFARYGYSGFFDVKEVDLQTLKNILEKDLEILHLIDEMIAQSEKGKVEKIEDALVKLNELTQERKNIIENVK